MEDDFIGDLLGQRNFTESGEQSKNSFVKHLISNQISIGQIWAGC